MYLLYSLLLTVGIIVLLPRFAIDALRAGKYVTGLRQRLGRLPNLPGSDQPLIWIHCVSVGETEAARPLINALRERLPNHRLVISTTTVTGQHVAQRAFSEIATAIFYFPIDWLWTVRRVLRTLRPAAVVIVETELWPNLFRECRNQSIPIALVNGRISGTSFRRYMWIRSFMAHILKGVTVASMQSSADAERIQQLGMPANRIEVYGNLKFDSAVDSGITDPITQELCERFGFKTNDNANERLLIAASTHDHEEAVVLEAFTHLSQRQPGQRVRLIIAPRHPERFDAVAEQIRASGFRWARRSGVSSASDRKCDILLLDSIGELRSVYPLADVAFIGGSIVPRGGHNVLEPAAQGVCAITGPHMNNFAAITKALVDRGGLVQLPNVSSYESPAVLASTVAELLSDDDRRRGISELALAVCEENRGATEHTIQAIVHMLNHTSTAAESLPFTPYHVTATK